MPSKVAKDPRFLHADREDSDETGCIDLSLRWGHMSFCWFCHVVAQIFVLFGGGSFLSLWLRPWNIYQMYTVR